MNLTSAWKLLPKRLKKIKKKPPLTWREFQTIAKEAGISSQEFYANDIQDNWIEIAGHQRTVQMSWEQTRAIAFNVGRFGNSDAKKFPKTMQQFWPLPWDKAEEKATPKDTMLQYRENQRMLQEMLDKNPEKLKAYNS